MGSPGSQIGSTSCNCIIRARIRDIDVSSLFDGQPGGGNAARSEAKDSHSHSLQIHPLPFRHHRHASYPLTGS